MLVDYNQMPGAGNAGQCVLGATRHTGDGVRASTGKTIESGIGSRMSVRQTCAGGSALGDLLASHCESRGRLPARARTESLRRMDKATNVARRNMLKVRPPYRPWRPRLVAEITA